MDVAVAVVTVVVPEAATADVCPATVVEGPLPRCRDFAASSSLFLAASSLASNKTTQPSYHFLLG